MRRPTSPIIVPPSGSFDGVDGAWSTFLINIGDDGSGRFGQNFKSLVSTSQSATLLPLQSDWCINSSCAERRGILPYNSRQSLGYQPNSSTQHQDLGLFSLEVQNFRDKETASGWYGLDSIGIGLASPESPILIHQLVAGHVSKEPFLSSLGLSTNLLDIGSGGVHSYLTNLNASKAIASLSYSYTAGARYRDKGILGSLILGGYDMSRCGDRVSISMPGPTNSSLVVGVQSITIASVSDAGRNIYSATSSSSGFFAVIDSSLPYLSLPIAICNAFEDFFMLTYDPETGFYLVNDTVFEHNRKQEATVTIQLGDDMRASVHSVSINLPYDAFDLVGSSPVFPQSTRYFPIRRAADGINILGRTFLQESMLVVDYGRRNFTVAQAKFASPMPSARIVAIVGLKGHATDGRNIKVLVVILPVVVLASLVILLVVWWRSRSRSKNRHQERPISAGSTLAQEIASVSRSELPSPLSQQTYCFEKPVMIAPIELPAAAVDRVDCKL